MNRSRACGRVSTSMNNRPDAVILDVIRLEQSCLIEFSILKTLATPNETELHNPYSSPIAQTKPFKFGDWNNSILTKVLLPLNIFINSIAPVLLTWFAIADLSLLGLVFLAWPFSPFVFMAIVTWVTRANLLSGLLIFVASAISTVYSVWAMFEIFPPIPDPQCGLGLLFLPVTPWIITIFGCASAGIVSILKIPKNGG